MIKSFYNFINESTEEEDEILSPKVIKKLKKMIDKFNNEFFSDDYYKTEGVDACYQATDYYTIYPIKYDDNGITFTIKSFDFIRNKDILSTDFYEFTFYNEDDIPDLIKQYRKDIKLNNKILDKEREYDSKGKTYDPLEDESLDDIEQDN